MLYGNGYYSYLANDETIVASYEKGGNKYYATDRRLIFTRKKHLEDATYNHITTISMDKRSHKILIALGIIFLLIGIVTSFMNSTLGIIVILLDIILWHCSLYSGVLNIPLNYQAVRLFQFRLQSHPM